MLESPIVIQIKHFSLLLYFFTGNSEQMPGSPAVPTPTQDEGQREPGWFDPWGSQEIRAETVPRVPEHFVQGFVVV